MNDSGFRRFSLLIKEKIDSFCFIQRYRKRKEEEEEKKLRRFVILFSHCPAAEREREREREREAVYVCKEKKRTGYREIAVNDSFTC